MQWKRQATRIAACVLVLWAGLASADVVDEIDDLMRAGKWDDALTRSETALADDPDNGMVWYQLGIIHLQREEYADGAKAFIKAAEQGAITDFSWFNAACAYTLMGETDAGLDCLEKAFAVGFDHEELVETDADIAPLRELPRFKEIYNPPVYEPHPWSEPVTFNASDGSKVFGVLYRARHDGSAAPAWDERFSTIILCHQSVSNHAEYVPIAPRLAEMGFHCLAIDMRGGGKKYGRVNETAERWKQDHNGQRGRGVEAQLDMEGAVAWVRNQGFEGKIMLWGSSYSAGRILTVAVEHPQDVAATLSFSIGRSFAEPGDDGSSSVASRVNFPVFMTWPEHEFNDDHKRDFEQLATSSRVLLAQQGGVHGSSTLHPDKNPDGNEAVWMKVTAFLNAYGRPERP